LGVRDVRVVVLGDGECLDEARRAASARGLDPWVSFPGWVPERDVFAHLATADVGIDASLQEEVSPVKVLEYMAFGVPFAAFDLAETRAIGADAGVLVTPGDVAALARAVVSLLEDPARRATLARAGRGRTRDHLAWEHQATTYVAVVNRARDRARERLDTPVPTGSSPRGPRNGRVPACPR
jgi:glycosyltransferase involved in cell wall biosynthesis